MKDVLGRFRDVDFVPENGEKPCALDYAGGFVVEHAQLLVDRLARAVASVGTCSARSLKGWVSVTPSLIVDEIQLAIVGRFTHLGSCLTKDDE